MYVYEITKYNPLYREYKDGTRTYLKNEWTSISDIGKRFDDGILTLEEYIKVEDSYVKAIIFVLEHLDINNLKIKKIEKITGRNFIGTIIDTINGKIKKEKNEFNFKMKNKMTELPKLYTKSMVEFSKECKKNQKVNLNEIETLVRLTLREDLWCCFDSKKIEINVGYDYLMNINTTEMLDNVFKEIESLGLFIEQKKL